jgi:hypothetical protein
MHSAEVGLGAVCAASMTRSRVGLNLGWVGRRVSWVGDRVRQLGYAGPSHGLVGCARGKMNHASMKQLASCAGGEEREESKRRDWATWKIWPGIV